MPAMEALTFTKSRMASEENSANRTATAAAVQTAARIREDRDILRFGTGAIYSLGSGS